MRKSYAPSSCRAKRQAISMHWSAKSARARRSIYIYGTGRVIHCPSAHKPSPFERPQACGNRMRRPRARRSLYIYGTGHVIHCPSTHNASPFERLPSCRNRMRRPRARRSIYIYGTGHVIHCPPAHKASLLSVRRHAESVCAVRVQNELSTFTGQDAPPIAHPRATRSCRNAPTSPFRGSSARNANRRGATPCPGGPPGTLPHRLYR